MQATKMKRCAALAVVACLLGGCGPLKRLSYEGFGRDAWQQPERVVAALGIAPGDRVADLGSGSGYFTIRLAPAVGSAGKVYAVDVDPEMNGYLRDRLAREKIANVEVILGRPEDPLLPDGGVDLVVTVDTYHHIEDRPVYFRNLRRDLAPGGRVAVIDYDGRKGWFVWLTGHHAAR
jgi:ubiquinone/menaquinone biosynthesis C-methylase UbiE